MATEIMLTTVDNPFDPFEDYPAWFSYDVINGYHTPSLLASIVVTSSELSDEDQRQALEDAIDSIVNITLPGIYKKVTKEIPD